MAVLLIFSFVILTGCKSGPGITIENNNNMVYNSRISGANEIDKVIVYYFKDGFLVPVTLTAEAGGEPAKTALSNLFSFDAPKPFENMLREVRLINFDVADGLAVLDVSKEFLKGEVQLKKLQIVFTLTEFQDITGVRISVEGEPFEEDFERPELINETPSQDTAAEISTVTVYYADKDRNYLVPVTYAIKNPNLSTEEKASYALARLLEGPGPDKKLGRIFPDNVTLKNFYIRDTIAYVDVGKDLLLDLLDESHLEKIAVESVVQTLTSIEGVEKVQFLIDGKVMGSIAGHVNIGEPISRIHWINLISTE
ncbi:GerMN domain-containing protein [Thermosediminibacter litoriperuensis]|uniref:GerMN domain-containing protein n=1 Tax=Thermosediminibacter litoriperuensis TaxID=291989 RepID=UPI0014790AF8|nr:GerMN domain-containing protein [Thermosediminibacter litoriperuensis]